MSFQLCQWKPAFLLAARSQGLQGITAGKAWHSALLHSSPFLISNYIFRNNTELRKLRVSKNSDSKKMQGKQCPAFSDELFPHASLNHCLRFWYQLGFQTKKMYVFFSVTMHSMAFAVKSSRCGLWTLQEEKPPHFLSNCFNPAEDNHSSSHESNSPPLLKAVPPHTLAAVTSSFSFPYTHCSFQLLQTVPTFVSEISFCPQWCCRTSSRTHGAAAA